MVVMVVAKNIVILLQHKGFLHTETGPNNVSIIIFITKEYDWKAAHILQLDLL